MVPLAWVKVSEANALAPFCCWGGWLVVGLGLGLGVGVGVGVGVRTVCTLTELRTCCTVCARVRVRVCACACVWCLVHVACCATNSGPLPALLVEFQVSE